MKLDKAKEDFELLYQANKELAYNEGWEVIYSDDKPEIKAVNNTDDDFDSNIIAFGKVLDMAEKGSELHAATLIYIELANPSHYESFTGLIC